MMQSEHTAPCPTTSLSLPALLWDTRPEISESELAALDTLVDHFQQGGKNWSPDIQKRLSRLLLPLRDTLTKMHAAKAPLQFIYSRYSPGDAAHPENILGLDTRRVVRSYLQQRRGISSTVWSQRQLSAICYSVSMVAMWV